MRASLKKAFHDLLVDRDFIMQRYCLGFSFFEHCWGQMCSQALWNSSAVHFFLTAHSALGEAWMGRDAVMCPGSWALHLRTVKSWLPRSLQVWSFLGVQLLQHALLFILNHAMPGSLWTKAIFPNLYVSFRMSLPKEQRESILVLCIPPCIFFKSA